MKLYRIRDWAQHFENNRTKEIKKLAWVPFPNKHDGDGYTELLDHENGPACYGAWCVLVQIASKCDPRGTLLRDTLKPHTPQSLARMSRFPVAIISEALDVLVSIGWIEVCEYTAPSCGDAAPSCGSPEQNRTEQKGTEQPPLTPPKLTTIFSESVYEKHPLLKTIHSVPMLRAVTLEIWLKCVQRRNKHMDWPKAVKFVCDKAELQTIIRSPGDFLDRHLSYYEKDHLTEIKSREASAIRREQKKKELRAFIDEWNTSPDQQQSEDAINHAKETHRAEFGQAFIDEVEKMGNK